MVSHRKEISIKFYSQQSNKIVSTKIVLSKSSLVYPNLYKKYTDKFYHIVNDLTISVITKKHLEG